MNKYAWLVYHKEYDAFLERLRLLGVVHIKPFKPTKDHPVIQQLTAENKRIKKQIDYLRALLKTEEERLAAEKKGKTPELPVGSKPETSGKQLSRVECEALLGKVEDLREQLAKIQSARQAKEKEREAISLWGDFSYRTIEKIQAAGYHVTFFTCPEARYNPSWEDEYHAFVINTVLSQVYFVTVTQSCREVSIDADRVKMPLKDYQQLSEEIAQDDTMRDEMNAQLLTIAQTDLHSLEQLEVEVENESVWNHALVQTDHKADSKVMLLEGWIPQDKATEMEQTLTEAGFCCMPLEVTDEDVVPIKLKNNYFSKLFEPITKLYSLPNYNEFDPTPLFAPFFMLFFGLCLADGGYGLLLMITAIVLKRKVNENMKPMTSLVFLFGAMTLVVGILTGSFFGVSLVEVSYFSSVKKYFLTSDNLMIISLVIGFFHVLYGKFIAAIKIKIQRGFKYSLSSFAWIFVIIAFACLFVLPMANVQLSKPVEYALYGVAALCGAVVLFYNTPGKNIFLNVGSGLWNTYNVVSGLVGDVLSYIRLYAIGLTGALLGGVFNSMAIDMTASMDPLIRWLPMLLILLVGHALNIALSLISSLVHPIRLIYVEYYKNSEFEGGGIDYKPFRKL
ncbi:ATPase [Bacteroides sp. OttesenSCG-928-D19]|nr:ATPase [Bacteroides sp. OttesenSCG-928-D19]